MCPEQLSEHVSQLLSRLLNPDPRQRYTPEQALNCAWVRHADASTLANVATATREHAESSATRQSKLSWKVIFRLPQQTQAQALAHGQLLAQGQAQQLPSRQPQPQQMQGQAQQLPSPQPQQTLGQLPPLSQPSALGQGQQSAQQLPPPPQLPGQAQGQWGQQPLLLPQPAQMQDQEQLNAQPPPPYLPGQGGQNAPPQQQSAGQVPGGRNAQSPGQWGQQQLGGVREDTAAEARAQQGGLAHGMPSQGVLAPGVPSQGMQALPPPGLPPPGLPPLPAPAPTERAVPLSSPAQLPQFFVQFSRPVAAGIAQPDFNLKGVGVGETVGVGSALLPLSGCGDAGSRSQLKRAADTSEGDAASLPRQRVSDGAPLPVHGSSGSSACTQQDVLVGSSDDEDIIPRRGILFDHVAKRGWDSLPKGTEQLLRDLLVTL
jgi:hypothetical protein